MIKYSYNLINIAHYKILLYVLLKCGKFIDETAKSINSDGFKPFAMKKPDAT
jgi:hypothetical protein